MKKKRIISFILTALLTTGLISAFSLFAPTEKVSAGIKQEIEIAISETTLEFTADVHIMYGVRVFGTVDTPELLVWSKEDFLSGADVEKATVLSPEENKHEDNFVFTFKDLYARQMVDEFVAKARVSNGEGGYIYSAPYKYSVLKYALMINAVDTSEFNGYQLEMHQKMLNLVEGLLNYGALSQQYFGYKTERLASDTYYTVRLSGGFLEDGFSTGVYLSGETATLTAKDENSEGVPFEAWYLDGEKVSTEKQIDIEVDGDKNYVANYELIVPTFTLSDTGRLTITIDGEDKLATSEDLNEYEGKVIVDNGENLTVVEKTLQEVVSDAKKDETVSVVLPKGTYTLSGGNSESELEISGVVDENGNKLTTIDNATGTTNYKTLAPDAKFTNVVFTGRENKDANPDASSACGFAHNGDITYENCTFTGSNSFYNYNGTQKFINCTFTNTSYFYAVWIYGTGNYIFEGCTLNCVGEGFKVYANGNKPIVTFTDCTFTSDGTGNGGSPNKPAIAIDTASGGFATVYITGETTQTGFKDNYSKMADYYHTYLVGTASPNTKIYIDGELVFPENKIKTVQDLESAVENGGEYVLANDINLGTHGELVVSKSFEIDLNGKSITSKIISNSSYGCLFHVKNEGEFTVKDSTEDKNGKIESNFEGQTIDGSVVWNEGKFNLFAGKIAITGASPKLCFTVDSRPNAWGQAYRNATVFNMYGGEVYNPNDEAIRIMVNSASSYVNDSSAFNMTGGKVEGWDAIFIQEDTYYRPISVNLSGGTLIGRKAAIRIYLFDTMTGVLGSDQTPINITLNGDVALTSNKESFSDAVKSVVGDIVVLQYINETDYMPYIEISGTSELIK